MSPQQGRSGYHKGVSERIPDNVAEKLREIVVQHNELANQLLDPDVLTDHRKVTSLSIKKAVVAPIVEQFNKYEKQTYLSFDYPLFYH